MTRLSPETFLENLSHHLKQTIARAIGYASSHGYDEVVPLHLLLSILQEQGSIASHILAPFDISVQSIEAQLDALDKATSAPDQTLAELDKSSKKALEKAMLLAYEEGHSFVGTEHLLYGLMHIRDTRITNVLREAEITRGDVDERIAIALDSTSQFPDPNTAEDTLSSIESLLSGSQESSSPQEQWIAIPPSLSKKRGKQKNSSPLEMFAIDLTTEDQQAYLDHVIGRDQEINRLINILSRRTKNNPVLVGEPGVGKTAIVEGLAKRIAEGDVPHVLQNKHIYALDLALLISGTIYRGEFESRLKGVIDELASKPDAILFIDELHNIIGAGSNQGTMDAANILKPALARGQLRCIGATTIDEFKKYIVSDPALERRFQAIPVDEPSIAQTKTILHGIKEHYEGFHDVIIADEAIDAAVDLATKYIHDNFLPDKAIDLLDEAAAQVNVTKPVSDHEVQTKKLLKQKQRYQTKKEKAIAEEALEDALKWKEKEATIARALEEHKNTPTESADKTTLSVTESHVASVLGQKLTIDPSLLMMDDVASLKRAQQTLKKVIIGQDHVIDGVMDTLKAAAMQIGNASGPRASLLFVGPSGVGKTALASALAKTLYHDENALIRIDMSEFAESHGLSKLLGSPAGYVGYGERNPVLDALRRRPYAVVLFDEFDKAHPDVRRLLLQMLDDGVITDAKGKKISLKHSIVALTSNLGAELFQSAGIGFGDDGNTAAQQSAIRDRVKEELGNPLLSRIDDLAIFAPLSKTMIFEIAQRQLRKINKSLASSQNIHIDASPDILTSLATDAYSETEGARTIERYVQRIITDLLINQSRSQSKKKTYELTREKDIYKLV